MHRKTRKHSTNRTKQEEAARFNNFRQQIYYYLRLLDCDSAACILDKTALKSMYKIRNINYPGLKISEGVIISATLKKEMHSSLDFHFSHQMIEIKSIEKKISLKGVLKYVAVINWYMNDISSTADSLTLMHAKAYFSKIPDFNLILKDALIEMHKILDFIGILVTSMNQSICWLEYKVINDGSNQRGFNIFLHEHIPEKKQIIIDGHARNVFPVCLAFANKGLDCATVSASDIVKNSSLKNFPIPVYFQNHLIHRLEERLDCFDFTFVQILLFKSFYNPKFIQFNHRILVEFMVQEHQKLGYIVVEYLDGILLAKTFLLLTNSGTPEGEKLKSISGLNKIDLKYWEIDKLSTFQNSDIKEQPKVREIFEKSGCGVLFNDFPFQKNEAQGHAISMAEQFLKFISK
jgi:hypothetical protein